MCVHQSVVNKFKFKTRLRTLLINKCMFKGTHTNIFGTRRKDCLEALTFY